MNHQPQRRRSAAAIAACLLLMQFFTMLAGTPPATADEPTWPIDWKMNRPHDVDELSREFDRDENGIIDPIATAPTTRLPQILNPQQFTLYVDACAAPPGFTSVDWQLARPNEEPQPTVTATECEAELVLPDLPYPEAREYDLTATVHYGESVVSVSRERIRVQDVFLVGLGDSYGSGEGNPIETWHFFGDDAKWDNARCHRSRLSGQEQAARMLDQLPGVTVTFLHLACSGALATTGILEPYAGLIPANPPLRPQITQAREYVEYSQGKDKTLPKRYPDVIVTSIGGNDAGFADVVKACLLPSWVPIPIPQFPFVFPLDIDECYEKGAAGDVLFKKGLQRLPDLYAQIDAAIEGRHPDLPGLCDPNNMCDFLITEYPDGSTNEDGEPCESSPPGFNEDEFTWVIEEMVPQLDGLIQTEAVNNDWVYVNEIRDNFYKHGICAKDDWLRDIPESFEVQGDQNGSFHPDASGHLFGYAPAITESLQETLGFVEDLPIYTGPLYGGTGAPQVCDSVAGNGDHEHFRAAPPTDVSSLNLPPSIAQEITQGTLPNGVIASSSCADKAVVRAPMGQAPVEMRSGNPGCPDDPRPCAGSSAGSSLLRFPLWGDESPAIDARAEADVDRKAGGPTTVGHDYSAASVQGTTVFYAAPFNGSETVSGEIVVDLDAVAQANGAIAFGRAEFQLEVNLITDEEDCGGYECTPTTTTPIAGVNVQVHRDTCAEDAEFEHNCRVVYGHQSIRTDQIEVHAWAGDEAIVDISEWNQYPYGSAASVTSVSDGLPLSQRQIRLPFSVPAGSVVTITPSVEVGGSNLDSCVVDLNNFPCSAHGRMAARISFDSDVATGSLVPLSGFVAPAADNTPPVITATPAGTAGDNGWYRSNVDVALHATDAGGSGVKSVEYSVDGGQPVTVPGDTATVAVPGDGNHTVAFTALDGAGNHSASGSLSVKIDAAAPTIAVTPADGATLTQGNTVSTDLHCDDATSGAASCTGPATLDTATPGAKAATFTATDNAGNSASRTLNYTVLAPPPPPPPPPPVAADGLSISIPEIGLSLTGNVASGGFTVTRAANGQPTTVIGTATLAGPNGSNTTVTILVVRVLGVWVGATTVTNQSTGVNVVAGTISRAGVTATATGATGTFTTPRPTRTVTWTVIDRV